MKERSDEPHAVDGVLAEAIRAVAQDDAGSKVPPHVETAIMQAWDSRARATGDHRHRTGSRRLWFVGLAATVMLSSAAMWMIEGGVNDHAGMTSSAERMDGAAGTDGLAADAGAELATMDVVLDEDPTSLQVVQLSVEPAVLTAFGFPVADFIDGRPIEIEVLVGLDGVPRAIRNANRRPSPRSQQ
jgi:hypothetical protein